MAVKLKRGIRRISFILGLLAGLVVLWVLLISPGAADYQTFLSTLKGASSTNPDRQGATNTEPVGKKKSFSGGDSSAGNNPSDFLDSFVAEELHVQPAFPWVVEALIALLCAALVFGAVWWVPYWVVASTIRFAKWIADGFRGPD
jgi:hypothetical protein